MIKQAKYLLLSMMIILLSAGLTGCGDLVEIQDRDFVLAIGVSAVNQHYQITYALPNLSEVTEQAGAGDQSNLIRTYEGKSLPEIDQRYNTNSENRLDYRHLQVIIFDQSIVSDAVMMKDLLNQINDNYNISHNVLVYYYADNTKDLMSVESVSGSIGEHLKKLNSNNHISDIEPAKIGALIDCMTNNRTLFIPTLYNRDHSIAVNGGIFFQNNQLRKEISQQNSEYYYITMGKNNDFLIRPSEEYLIQLKQVKSKLTYDLTAEGPLVKIQVEGSAVPMPRDIEEAYCPIAQLNEFIRHNIQLELDEFIKKNQIDYLNLYEKSSYKDRQIWLRYQNRPQDFINDLKTEISVDIRYQ